ncbi:MAG: biopolymer transporter ExbD [Candidatus Marinamargulisbacteria bacterium]|nr:biopolymer transporter ExbD [Candidatus Marinamargulisbacteria bacterium]|tara:strand:- start:2861 stop:3238 length:378 start_codon:yes stop_codon:yes gene_type:complete
MILQTKKQSAVHVDMIPLIDSLFVLLAFFLIAISTMVIQKTLPIHLPTASTAVTITDPIPTIGIDANEQLYWSGQPIALEGLNGVLPDTDRVIIQADENVRQKVIVQVLDQVKRNNIHTVMVQTQ